MTKKIDETLKKANVEKKKTSLRIEKKASSKPTKKVILEAPILDQISAPKTTKRTISRKKPEPKALGSLSDVKKQKTVKKVTTPEKEITVKPVSKVEIEKVDIEKVEIKKAPETKAKKEKTVKKSRTSLKPVTPKPNSQKNSRLLDTKQILVKPKRTLKLNIESKITPEEDEKINSIIGFENVPSFEASPIPAKKEVSINQNASFFYEPSIFQKFNIEVSNADEDIIENDIEVINQTSTNDIEIDDEQIEVRIIEPETNILEEKDTTNNIIETQVAEETSPALENIENTESVSETNEIITETNDNISDTTEINETKEATSDITEGTETNISESENELIDSLLDEIIEDELKEEKVEDNFDFVSTEVPEEFKEIVEKNIELSEQKQKFIENASNEYDFISTETPDIYKPAFSFEENEFEENENLQELENTENSEILPTEIVNENTVTDISITDEKIVDVDDILDSSEITLNDIDISDISLEDIENSDNLIEVDFTSTTEEDLKQESADNLITDKILENSEEKNNIDDNAIGKFFDSSIPNIHQEADDSYFKKIKKSLFSNISTVFKKFSYEEASLINSEIENNEEASPIIDITKSSTTDIKQVLENFDSPENIINNLEVSAEPNTLVLPCVDEKILENQESSLDSATDTFTNVLTPQSTNTDDLLLDDIDIDDLDISDIETILGQTTDIENNTVNEDVVETNEETDLIVDEESNNPIDSVIEDSNETSTPIDSIIEDSTETDNIIDLTIEEDSNEIDDTSFEEFDDTNELDELSSTDIDKELEEVLGITQEEDQFSIEDYFGVTVHNEDDNDTEEEFYDEENEEAELEENQDPMESFSKLIENFSQTISTLSNKITELETNITTVQPSLPSKENDDTIIENAETVTTDVQEITNEDDIQEVTSNEPVIENNEETNIDDISLDDISLDDISLDDISLDDIEALENDEEEASLLPTEETENVKSVEDILLEAFDNPDIDEQMKQDLLSEVLSVEDDLTDSLLTNEETVAPVETETTSDFFKIIDSLSKTISELEKAPDIEETNSLTESVAPVPENTSDKAINILINKDDIFSIAISNETYEIVTDFDGISVLSENIHISTPKNNFYVNIGEKYIEIHKQPDLFVVNTNFEDIEFANAINNVTFAKKKNKIELNIKEAFKISSVHKKIELSMLNTSIANLAGTQEKESSDSESSVCDNKTLVINEETQKVYLPYTIEEVMKKLNSSSEYQSLEDVIEHEYTLPLSTFKMPIISRFKEAYRFMRVKEKTSVYAALDLAVELMFNSNLNPAVIRASKDLKELNIYLDCLYENEIEKFDCFKVIYKVLPKIQ